MGRGGFSPLLLVVAAAVASLSCPAAAARANLSDADVITDFTKLLSNPPPSWVGGGDVCDGTFAGITCEGSGRIIGIDLKDQGLSGTLTPLLSSLTALRSLQLQGNALAGPVPSLAGMTSLARLSLQGNSFTSLPHDFLQGLPSLIELVMDNLPLEPWSIPAAVADCTVLQKFFASNASVSGPFPAVLASLKSLRVLSLSFNFLTGELPDHLGRLDDSALETLQIDNQLSGVKLSGPIEVLASFKNMKVLFIQSNKFTGPIPDFHQPLQSLNLRDNMLTGVVPASLTEITSLQTVWLSNNLLQGPVPQFSTDVAVDIYSGNSFCLHESGPCNPTVSSLLELSSGFGYPVRLAETWAGDNACCGKWFGIICRNAVVVEINLSGQNLSGTISPALANLKMLERIDLSNNNISGLLPETLTTLSNLIFLDVSNNKIMEPVPRFNASVMVIGASNASSSPSSGKSKSKKKKVIIGTEIGLGVSILIVLVVCIGLLLCHRNKKKRAGAVLPTQQQGSGAAITTELKTVDHFESHLVRFTMDVLLQATNSFSEDNKLGEGGWGVVFKGVIDGNLVAIKRWNHQTDMAKCLEEFNAEINVLGKLRHRHLIKLLGYCTDNMERLLVYEYMQGGTLRDHLLQRNFNFTWKERIIVARDIARGIEYIHNFSLDNFIHRDIKSSNILLDGNLRAKVSDFGLVKAAKDGDKSISGCNLVGTYGYLAPEYASTGKVTRKLDVYAYGIILVELISGRNILDETLNDDEKYFLPIFRKYAMAKVDYFKIIDPSLHLTDEDWTSLSQAVELSYQCTAKEPSTRPDMSDCISFLSRVMDQWSPTMVADETEAISIRIDQIDLLGNSVEIADNTNCSL